MHVRGVLRSFVIVVAFGAALGLSGAALAQDIADDIEATLPEGVTMETATPEQLAAAVADAIADNPNAAADIAGAVAKEVPEAAAEIAGAVAGEVPQAAADIVAAIVTEVPNAQAQVTDEVIIALGEKLTPDL